LLARLKHERGLDDQSVALGIQALATFERLGDSLRIASTQDKLARAYARLGQRDQAALAYEDSGKNYQIAKQWADAAYGYQQAAALRNGLGQVDAASRCAIQGAHCALHSDDLSAATNSLAEAAYSDNDVGYLYSELLERFLKDDHPTNFSGFMINFASFCKARVHSDGKKRFKTGIELCVNALTSDFKTRISNALAVGLEQAQNLLDCSELDSYTERIVDSVEHFHYRADPNDVGIWTIGLRWKKPIVVQLISLIDEPIGRRLAMSIALILLGNKEALEETVEEFGGNQESGFMLQIISRKDLEEAGTHLEMSAEPNIQAFFGETNVPWDQPQPPAGLIVEESYDEFSDWSRNPGSKTFLWVLMNVHQVFVGHCSHKKRGYSGFAGKASKFCQLILK
jgi:hypothetical protein